VWLADNSFRIKVKKCLKRKNWKIIEVFGEKFHLNFLHIYPTGSEGIFNIFIEYKQREKNE
jgi:hypothetical protein